MSLDEIKAAIPHRPPFLLVDEIVLREEERIICRKTFQPDEYFYAGHYPEFPLTPGVLLCEAAMQAGAVLLSSKMTATPGKVPVAARMNDVRFKRMVRPGETIEMEVSIKEKIREAYYLDAKVTCAGKVAVRFEFACVLASAEAE